MSHTGRSKNSTGIKNFAFQKNWDSDKNGKGGGYPLELKGFSLMITVGQYGVIM